MLKCSIGNSCSHFWKTYLQKTRVFSNTFHCFSTQPTVNHQEVEKSVYQDGSLVSQYLDFHYSQEQYFGVGNFHRKCAELCVQVCQEQEVSFGYALDGGCAVGRSSFELAKMGFDQVFGIDVSERFVKLAQKINEKGVVRYTRLKEGSIYEIQEVSLKSLGLEKTARNVKFQNHDLQVLASAGNTRFDLVFLGNVLCRMQYPKQLLKTIDQVMKPDGILVISSTYSWTEEFTKKKEWIGGIFENRKEYSSKQGLNDILINRFDEIKTPANVEFVIRENQREFIHSIAEISFWRLKK